MMSKSVIARLKMKGKPYSMQILAKSLPKDNVMMSVHKLMMHNTKYSIAMGKLLKSCIANAASIGVSSNNLAITDLSVGRGKFTKRRGFKGRGRTELIRKPSVNVFVTMNEVQHGK